MDKQQGPVNSTGNFIQCPIINYNGKEYEKFIYIYINPMDHSTLGFPVHHQLLEIAQTHVH